MTVREPYHCTSPIKSKLTYNSSPSTDATHHTTNKPQHSQVTCIHGSTTSKTGRGPTFLENPPLRTAGQDINLPTKEQPTTTEEQASLTVTQDMIRGTHGYAMSVEQRLKQRVQPRSETSRKTSGSSSKTHQKKERESHESGAAMQ